MLPSQGEGPNVVEGARGVERREARLKTTREGCVADDNTDHSGTKEEEGDDTWACQRDRESSVARGIPGNTKIIHFRWVMVHQRCRKCTNKTRFVMARLRIGEL